METNKPMTTEEIVQTLFLDVDNPENLRLQLTFWFSTYVASKAFKELSKEGRENALIDFGLLLEFFVRLEKNQTKPPKN